MPEPKDIQDGLKQAVKKVKAVFDSNGYPEDWKAYFLSKTSGELQIEAVKEATK